MWRDDYLHYCSLSCIITKDIKLSVIWYIACVDWLSRIAMADVTLTPNSWHVWGYPQINDQNKKNDTTIRFYAQPINDQEGLL